MVVFPPNAAVPNAVLFWPDWFKPNAPEPKAELEAPVRLYCILFAPTEVFWRPVVVLLSAKKPTAVLA